MEDEEACGDCPTRVQISDFKIDKCQLQGSFASVYSCKHKSRRDELSMVRLAKRAYFQPPGAKREWDVIASSGHPNLVSLHWSFELESDFILITGFCDMGSLRQYIDKNGEPGLTVEETRDVGRNILDALHFLHGKRILHRDVHPTNVGICGPVDSTTAKLIDLGFAKRDQSGVVIGSPGYRAPELERRRNGAFRQSSRLFEETIDLYSFGILVFVTLVGNEATSSKGCVWQHEDFRKMLVDADHCLWHCDIYQDTGIFGLCQLADMEDCGAVATISALTETDPKSRTQTAALARELPFFQKEQDNFDDA
jgi:serine/threonine protein kinase